MYKNYITKTAIFLYFFVTVTCLTAQDTGTYKYIIFSTDTTLCTSSSGKILEVNNLYYAVSSIWIWHGYNMQRSTFMSVLDKNLNIIKQVPIPGDTVFIPFFYNNFFYLWGCSRYSQEYPMNIYFAKYDEDFNLVQPVITHTLDDTVFIFTDTIYDGYFSDIGRWNFSDILMTKNNEFIFHFFEYQTSNSLFMRFDINGNLLEELIIPAPPDKMRTVGQAGMLEGKLVEIDSNYIMNFKYRHNQLIIFSKDSLKKYKWGETSIWSTLDRYAVVAVGNQLIRCDYRSVRRERCSNGRPKEYGGYYLDRDIHITFLNEDFSLKNELIFGNECLDDGAGGYINYINPDSIYHVCRTQAVDESWEVGTATISISCFSSEGKLHFNHKLDIPDTKTNKLIRGCMATSDGGVLVTGDFLDRIEGRYDRGFLLLYHPPKNVGIAETPSMASLRVYPNPTGNQLRIKNYELREDAEYVIYSVVGQVVLQGKLYNNTINVESLASGMYLLKVDGKVVKFVKE